MASNWVFEITDNSTGSTIVQVVNNPDGWDKAVIKFKRDSDWHGVFADYMFDGLKFTDDALDILEAAYLAKGIEANTTITITWDCDIQQLLYAGKFNYKTYQKVCSFKAGCGIEIKIDSTGAMQKLRNRVDQKADLDKNEDFAGNATTPYTYLGFDIDLPAKGLLLTDRADREDMGSYIISDSGAVDWTTIRIIGNVGSIAGHSNVFFSRVVLEETADIIPEYYGAYVEGANFGSGGPQTQQVYEHGNANIAALDFECRIKGRIIWDFGTCTLEVPVGLPLELFVVSVSGGVDPNTVGSVTIIGSTVIKAPGVFNTDQTDEFDLIISTSFAVNLNQKFWFFIQWNLDKVTTGILPTITIQFDPETYYEFSGLQYAPTTPCKVYMINECFAKIIEHTTDSEMKMYSDYYGRTDAENYASDEDGCGSLRCLTNGLLIRRALIQGNQPLMTMSLKELFEGCKAIDCIGMGIEDDTDRGAGWKRIRVERFEHFYNTTVVMQCLSVLITEMTVNESGYTSVFKFGYEKYEAEEYNGIDEFLSKREYRANAITSVKNTLDQTCQFVASGYAIEVTRNKDTTTKDWRFDNDTFIICLEREYGVPFIVEQGNIDNPQNIIDPPTIYNYRISPIRNAMRWWKILFAQYNAASFGGYDFTNGTGNYFAAGIVTGGCVQEKDTGFLMEKDQLNYTIWAPYADNTPLWTNERVKFSYSMTVQEHNIIKANPYGMIEYSFANGPILKGWIDEINYHAAEGVADFVLIPEYLT